MGQMADDTVCQLVKGLCDSFSPIKKEVQEDEALFEMDLSTCYDQTLAELFDMGYDIELASRAIRDCGRLDVAAIIDHMNSGVPISTAAAPESSSMAPKAFNSALAPLSMEVKVEKEEHHVSTDENEPGCARGSTFDASSSKGKAIVEYPDDVNETKETVRHRKRSLSLSEPLGTVGKGKSPVSSSDEVDEQALDSDRWEYDDDTGTDKESTLLRMGFCQTNVTDALEACGEDSDVNHLANYIMNNIVDLPANDSSSEDYGPVGDDLLGEESMKQRSGDLPGEETTDQELQIFRKLRSMGFSFTLQMVSEAVKACGKEAAENDLVNYLLGTDEQKAQYGTAGENVEELQPPTLLQQLKQMSCCSTAACLRAIDNNRGADIGELLDYVFAEALHDELSQEDEQVSEDDDDCDQRSIPKKRRKTTTKVFRRKGQAEKHRRESSPEAEVYHANRKGFGIPGEPLIPRVLSADIARPPYFYFENVASMPGDEWRNIQRHLYNIDPEFVDSLNFSPCRRPRGYIHNLPLEGRADLLPKPPMTIQELIPGSAGFIPYWDARVKLNTINTRTASEFVRRQIQESMAACENGEPTAKDIKTILFWAKKWNLVWIRPGELAPLSPEEVEICLGFDRHHTRVLFSQCDRVRVLGNSFQVNTVAYHLSVLRPLYSGGIRVLSLFSGIGGAEVALHKLGIFLKVVVSVEIDDKARMVVDSWWKTTNQKGILIHSFHDVRELDSKAIQKLVEEFGGFDLVIGGSPCNNLSGNNRCSRTGLAGPASVSFFEFPRILADVRDFMVQRRRT